MYLRAGNPDLAEKSVRLIVGPRGEGNARIGTGIDAPKTVDHNRLAVLVAERAEQSPRVGIEGIDPTIAEIAHEQRTRELAEIFRRDGQSPRRIQRPVGDQVLHQLATVADHIDIAEPGPADFIGPADLPL